MVVKRKIAMTYSFLFLGLLGACVFLALQVRQYINDRSDPLDGYKERLINTNEIIDSLNREDLIDKNQTLSTFAGTRMFAPIATPIPRPSPTPMPPPSPTPVVVARGWTLLNVFSDQFANMKDFSGKKVIVNVGKEVPNVVQGQDLGFTVIKIDAINKWVKVQDKQGNTSILHENREANAKPAPQRVQPQRK